MGCIARLGCLVVLVCLGVAAWFTRDKWMSKVTGSAPTTTAVSTAPVWEPLTPEAERTSVQRTLEAAQAAAPGMKLSFMAFPGTSFSSPHHNTFFMRGNTPLTSRLLQPVLVDARTAEVTAAPQLPWYLTALLVSQPLHFGDYGGLPMKALWALLDIATILVLGSGLYLWLKRRAPKSLADEAGASVPMNV